MKPISSPVALAFGAVVSLLSGCAGAPQLYEVKSVYVCAAEECGQAGQRFSTAQMLRAMHRLIAANDGQEYKVCASDPKTRNCVSEGVGYFVMGGPLPGRGAQSSGRMSAPKLDMSTQSVSYTMNAGLTFMGTPLVCAEHPARVIVRAADQLTIEDTPYFCNWMGVGNMTTTFSFAVESIDLDRGRLGGYWAHAVAGTGNGRGSGYAVMQFPRAMARGEDWLAE